MRHFGMLLFSSLIAAACASNPPPPASSASVETAPVQANTGADFSAPPADGLTTTPAVTRTVDNTWGAGTDNTNPYASTGNVAASPDVRSPDADSERNGAVLTPMDQGTSEADRAMTMQIRQAVMHDKSLSSTAKNVKVITLNGKVTLSGAVKTDAERAAVEGAARNVAGGAQVDSQLEVSK